MSKARGEARLDSRAYTWFAAVVTPQKELTAETLLCAQGFATFVPVRKEYRYANKFSRAQGRKEERRFPLFPRYVFIGMNERTPGWGELLQPTHHRYMVRGDDVQTWPSWRYEHLVQGVIGHDGVPVEVPHDPQPVRNSVGETTRHRPGLRDLMWKHNAGEFNAPGYQRYMETHREFGPGDDVFAIDENLRGRVIEIVEDRAIVELPFFGAYRQLEVALAKLRSVE